MPQLIDGSTNTPLCWFILRKCNPAGSRYLTANCFAEMSFNFRPRNSYLQINFRIRKENRVTRSLFLIFETQCYLTFTETAPLNSATRPVCAFTEVHPALKTHLMIFHHTCRVFREISLRCSSTGKEAWASKAALRACQYNEIQQPAVVYQNFSNTDYTLFVSVLNS